MQIEETRACWEYEAEQECYAWLESQHAEERKTTLNRKETEENA